jgi:hypothetical protein
MAGTLTISTLSDGTNSTSATNPIKGSAKAWVNYNGIAQTVYASYNVSSVTRNGAGDYTLNFTNAFTDTNYIGIGNAAVLAGAYASFSMSPNSTASVTIVAPTTTAFRFTIFVASVGAVDSTYVQVACFR